MFLENTAKSDTMFLRPGEMKQISAAKHHGSLVCR